MMDDVKQAVLLSVGKPIPLGPGSYDLLAAFPSLLELVLIPPKKVHPLQGFSDLRSFCSVPPRRHTAQPELCRRNAEKKIIILCSTQLTHLTSQPVCSPCSRRQPMRIDLTLAFFRAGSVIFGSTAPVFELMTSGTLHIIILNNVKMCGLPSHGMKTLGEDR